MIAIAGSPARLRPHIKTHKLAQIVALQSAMGISKCKCATLAEAEMAAGAGATDILLALQPVGPNQERFIGIVARFPKVRFSTLIDDPTVADSLGQRFHSRGRHIEVLVDLDLGQHRTGIVPGPAALDLYHRLSKTPGLRPGGLHAYDGHLHQSDPAERAKAAQAALAPVLAMESTLREQNISVPRLVLGGTPTFPIHAQLTLPSVELSPGTCVLWDAGYATRYPDLDFLHAAQLLTRVVSRPSSRRICLDLGHKAVASEMPQPRVTFPSLPDAKIVLHSEEHLVVETAEADRLPPGSLLHAIPWHICPTVALHERVYVVQNGQPGRTWPVTARARSLQP
jgi:D-serine deaminase-like pyridoxal phosphate-dependent protein